jgi:hypothetical protein
VGSSLLAVAALILLWGVNASGLLLVPRIDKARRRLGRVLHRLGDERLAALAFVFAGSLLGVLLAGYSGIFRDLWIMQAGAYRPSAANDYYGAAMSGYVTLVATMAALLAARLTERATLGRAFVRLGACAVTALFFAAIPYRLRVHNEAEEVGFPISSTDTARAFVLDFGHRDGNSVPLYIPGSKVRMISDSVEKSLKGWRPRTDGQSVKSLTRRTCEIFGDADCGGAQ